MKITGYGSIGSGSNVAKRGNAPPAGAFSDVLAAAESESAATAAPASDIAVSAALTNLLALQEISEEDIKRRKLTQQGENMLETLRQLHQRLLAGSLPPRLLQDLSREISLDKQLVNDPALSAIIADIELRAAVELAKLEKGLEDARAGKT